LVRSVLISNSTDSVLITQPDEIPDAQATPPGTNVYFEDLALQPMQLEISFMRTERVNVDDK
jgi:vacuolar protein sorting-associated protein 13A/C